MKSTAAQRRCEDAYAKGKDKACEDPLSIRSPIPAISLRSIRSSAPLRIGTRDFGSFFKGGIRKVRIWNRAIQEGEIRALFVNDTAPQDGLVAEYLLDRSTDRNAADTADGYDGLIFGAVWATQT